MTMYNVSTNLSQQVVQEVLTHFGDRVFNALIPRNVRLSEAPSFVQPVIVYDKHCPGSVAYRNMAKEFLAREKKRQKARKGAAEVPLTVQDALGQGG